MYISSKKIEDAKKFAITAHDGQLRKYTNVPYVVHAFEVSDIINLLLPLSLFKEDCIVAAILHDVVEDTTTSLEEIKTLFGFSVKNFVKHVTDVSKKDDGNRKVRKEIDANHYARGNYYSQSIKCADIISNTGSIAAYDLKFAQVYFIENEHLLEVLTEANEGIHKLARITLASAQANLKRIEKTYEEEN